MSIEEKLEEAVVTLLDKTINGVDATVDFLSEEVPAYIEQLLTWYMVQSFIMVGIGAVLFTIGWKVASKPLKAHQAFSLLTKEEKREQRTNAEWVYLDSYSDTCVSCKYVIYLVLGLIVGLVGFIMICANILEPIQILVAPHVWLVEYAADLRSTVK